MSTSNQPLQIRRRDPAWIVIEWADGHESRFSVPELRRSCPCAACVSELTGQRILDPASIPDDLIQQDVRLVGNYAITIHFSDGHQTGIFTFNALRLMDTTGHSSAPDPQGP